MRNRLQPTEARGQSMTEFVIIVALIAIATIGVIGLFGDDLRALFGASADNLAGKERAQVGKHSSFHRENKTMQTFGDATSGVIFH